MFITAAGRGEVLDPNNPTKEKEVLKGQYDVIVYERNKLRE